jgi:uncharacterized membrane protein
MKLNWFVYSLITMFGFAVMTLLFKKLTTMGLSSKIINLYFWGFTFLGFLLLSVIIKGELIPPRGKNLFLFLIIIAAIISVVANLALVEAIGIAPNPGYAKAVMACEVAIVAIASIFLFASEFTLAKGLGILLVILGVVLLGL